MCRPKLKDQLMMVLALVPFYESQMLTQMMDMSEFFDARITLGHAARVMSWNISVLDNMSST